MNLSAALAEFAAGRPVWVVGGCVRDRLLGRAWHDLDVVVDDTLVFARAFARHIHAHFVVLDDGRGTARVIDRHDRDQYIDFCEPQGASLADDLHQRDFTVNALACSLASWLAEPDVLDEVGGLADLAARQLRCVSPDSLLADPLRCLRAHRFAAALGFSIEPGTLARLASAAPGLAQVASERVRAEWLRLLDDPALGAELAPLAASGVLAALLPELPDGGADRLARMDALLADVAARPALAGWLGDGARGQARFAALCSAGWVASHARWLPERFALTRRERRLLTQALVPSELDEATLHDRLARDGLEVLGAVLMSGLDRESRPALDLVEALAPRLASAPLIDGHDLANVLCLAPGALFKVVLHRVRVAQLTGALGTREEALALAREVVGGHE